MLALARSAETLSGLPAGVAREVVDAGDPRQVDGVFNLARDAFGQIDLVVNAMTSPPRDQPFGGGSVVDAPPERLEEWLRACLPPAWNVLQASARVLGAQGHGTIVQIAGPSTRRVGPQRGAWGAAQMALRGVVEALVQEMRPLGIHVALLVADGEIVTDRYESTGRPPLSALEPGDIAHAVSFLAGQTQTAWTHQVVLTPRGREWVPA